MKILFLQHEGWMWGTARSLLALIDHLQLHGHECFVLLRNDGPLREALANRHIPCENFFWRVWTADEETSKPRRLLYGLRCVLHSRLSRARALEKVGDFKPDLVHSNTIKTNLGGNLAKALHVPHIWHIREFVGGRFSVGSEWSLGIRATSRHMSRHGEAVIAISEVLNREFANPELTIPIYIVHNGVMKSEQMKEVLSPVPKFEDALRFAFIGRFDDWKEPLVPLHAMKILKDNGFMCKLMMVGDGSPEYKKILEDCVRKNDLDDRVEFTGFVTEVSMVLKTIHALVMPSRGDAFGRVTAEAMAHGRPVIGANAGATPELVRDRAEGLIFPSGDAEALANRMQELIENPSQIAKMGRKAAERAQAEFTHEKYATAVMKIYEKVLGRPLDA